MSITLTSSYKEVLNTETVEYIDTLLEDNYALDDILEFIDNYNERTFVDNYEEYVRCGEAIGYEAVDAYADENGIDNIEGCDERYQGFYHSVEEFAEEFYTETMCCIIPDGIVVDWTETWERSLYYDFTACNDGSTYRPWHIFHDH